MQAERFESPLDDQPIDWESFYANYRKPGYVTGYEIVNKLGGGMFGMVFKARKESIGKDYAIKFLKVDDESVREAVRREVDSVQYFAQIDHPNLVSIEDRGEIDGIPYIIMNYAGQETLQSRLAGGRLERDDALRLFIQVARGVQALHEHSLVHFDLKPANIFLRGEIARVGDYGLSKLVTQSRNSLSFGRGTPYYMAPEMLQRRGDHRSDIYSLGVILYECLTGEVPFRGDSEWEVLRKHETEPPNFPAEIGSAERRVLERCLAKQPEERYESAAELLHDLQAPAALGESMVLPPPGTHQRAREQVVESRGVHRQAARPSEQAAPPFRGVRRRSHGPVTGLVHILFRLFEFAIFLVLVPMRALAVTVGRILTLIVQLPFRLFGVATKALGVLLAAAALAILVEAVF